MRDHPQYEGGTDIPVCALIRTDRNVCATSVRHPSHPNIWREKKDHNK